MVTTGVVVAQSVLVVQKEDIIFQFKMRDDDVSNKDYLLCVLYILSTYSAQRELLSLLLQTKTVKKKAFGKNLLS